MTICSIIGHACQPQISDMQVEEALFYERMHVSLAAVEMHDEAGSHHRLRQTPRRLIDQFAISGDVALSRLTDPLHPAIKIACRIQTMGCHLCPDSIENLMKGARIWTQDMPDSAMQSRELEGQVHLMEMKQLSEPPDFIASEFLQVGDSAPHCRQYLLSRLRSSHLPCHFGCMHQQLMVKTCVLTSIFGHKAALWH